MPDAISNTSPLLYLHRLGVLDWLNTLFAETWMPSSVANELCEGLQKGYDVPNPESLSWIRVVNPHSVPSEWLSLDLGPGELSAMALTLESPGRIVLLDDAANCPFPTPRQSAILTSLHTNHTLHFRHSHR